MDHTAKEAVVTGLGIISPAGNDLDTFANTLYQGEPGTAPLSGGAFEGLPPYLGARVRNFNLFDHVPTKKPTKFMGKITGFTLAAAGQAIQNAMLPSDSWDPYKAGVVLGSNADDFGFDELKSICSRMKEDHSRDKDAGKHYLTTLGGFSYLKSIPNMGANFVSIFHRIYGFSSTVCTLSCASVQALGYAGDLIARNEVDVIISGGGDSWMHPWGLIAYNELETLETSRAVDEKNGSVLAGEGAACLAIESREHAEKRGARVLAVIKGWGSSVGYENGPGPIADAIKAALDSAGLVPGDIDAIVAHGSACGLPGRAESKALPDIFNHRPPVFSIMPFTGHAVAGYGAMQSVAAILSMNRGMLFGLPVSTTPNGSSVNMVASSCAGDPERVLVLSINHDMTSTAIIFENGNGNKGD